MSVTYVDAAETVIEIIEDGYTLGNVFNSANPLFVNKNNNERKRVNAGNVPGIIMTYFGEDNPDYDNYGARKRADRVTRVSIEIKRFMNKKLLMSNVKEVRRILEVNQEAIEDWTMNNTEVENPYNRMYEVASKDLTNINRNSPFKFVIDVELWVVGQVRATS